MPKFSELSKEAKEHAIEEWRSDGYAFDDFDAKLVTEQFENYLNEQGVYGSGKKGWVFWSLGYCQGDGVCFEGTVDTDILFKKKGFRHFKDLAPHVGIRIRNDDSRYCHYNSMSIDVEPTFSWDSLMTDEDRRAVSDVEYEQKKFDREDDEGRRPVGVLEWSPDDPKRPEMPRRLLRAIERAKEKEKRLEAMIPELEEAVKEWVEDLSHQLEKDGYAEIEYRQSDEVIAETLEANDYEFDEDGDRL